MRQNQVTELSVAELVTAPVNCLDLVRYRSVMSHWMLKIFKPGVSCK